MTLKIKIWDVLLGLAIWIRTPNGKDIVIDAGINKENDFYPIYNLKKEHNVGSIDWAIITHPHKDHIDEIDNLVALNPGVLSRPKHITRDNFGWDKIKAEDKKLFEKYFELSERYSSPINSSNDPTSIENLGGVEVINFTPKSCSIENLNNQSIVTIINYAGSKILIPGDNEVDSWKELLKNKNFIEAIKGTDILVAPHHGRKSAYHKELFNFISPRLIIISDSPGTDTSANSRYSDHAKGWKVHSRSGQESKDRFVISTRQDGMIEINCGKGSPKNFMEVKID